MHSQASFGKKIVFSVAKKMVEKETTPSEAMKCKLLGGIVLDRVLQGRLGLSGEEKDAWKKYMKVVTNITPNSEKSFHKIFYFPKLGSEYPICHMLSNFKYTFPIEFYYGDSDWMEKNVAWELANNRVGGNILSYRIVEGAGHQIIFDNPETMAAYILQGIHHPKGL